MAELLPIEEARARVLDSIAPLGAEEVELDAALGRVLAERVVSDLDVPPFDCSAMDGFAVPEGAAGELRLIGEARAGHPFAATVEPGTAVRISTGAPLPSGAAAVVPVERCEGEGEGFVRLPAASPGANVRRAGEDVPARKTVLGPGAELEAAELGVLASLGRSRVRCALRPRVAVLVTGDELAPPGAELRPGQIFSSNAYALAAQVARAGGELRQREHVPDDPGATRTALAGALGGADVVCVSGGVSVGPHDHVKGALAELGIEEVFWGIRLKPGKPTWFGRREQTLVFGLPGNPVSAMVTFQLLVRPALRRLQGARPEPRLEAMLGAPIERNAGREQAVRVRLESAADGLYAYSTGAQGSHVLTSMLAADGLALIPSGEGTLAAGEHVEVEPL